MVTVYTYHLKAFAPNPCAEDRYFTYDNTVDRDTPLNNGQEYDVLTKGLSDHVHAETGVRVSPRSFVIQNAELLGTRQEKDFPAIRQAK
jgi:hypothetical protein